MGSETNSIRLPWLLASAVILIKIRPLFASAVKRTVAIWSDFQNCSHLQSIWSDFQNCSHLRSFWPTLGLCSHLRSIWSDFQNFSHLQSIWSDFQNCSHLRSFWPTLGRCSHQLSKCPIHKFLLRLDRKGQNSDVRYANMYVFAEKCEFSTTYTIFWVHYNEDLRSRSPTPNKNESRRLYRPLYVPRSIMSTERLFFTR